LTQAIFEFAWSALDFLRVPYFNRSTEDAIDHPRSPSAFNSVAPSFFSMLSISRLLTH